MTSGCKGERIMSSTARYIALSVCNSKRVADGNAFVNLRTHIIC